MAEESGVWLYAVAGDIDPARVAGLAGVGGGRTHTVEAAGLVAVVSPVDLSEFGEEPLRRNLEDLAWLEQVARAHHAVVDAVALLGPAVPARLTTVYRDDSRVRAMLEQRHVDFATVLDRITGRAEWGVKAYAVPSGSTTPEPSEASGDGATGPGTAYLRRRRAQLSADEQEQQAAMDSAEEVHTALSGHAEAARRHPPQDRKLTGQPGRMVLNGAYLVPAERARQFGEAFAALADRYRAIRLELTGPWPPYSFVAMEDEESQG